MYDVKKKNNNNNFQNLGYSKTAEKSKPKIWTSCV